MSAENNYKGSGGANDPEVRLVDPIDRYAVFVVRGAIIGTGILGLALFVRNSKLFATFQHVKQIPQDYYRRGIPLKGIVRGIEPNGLLKVQHQPQIRLPKILKANKALTQASLNIRLAGLEVSPVGTEYMLNGLKMRDRPIAFTMIKPAENQPDVGDADVTAKTLIRSVNINAELIRKGFARVYTLDNHWHKEAIQSNTAYSRLITRLITCEKVAEQRGLGLWERTTWVERLKSYPATALQIFKHSTPTKIAILSFEVLRDTLLTLYFFAQHLYYIGVELFKYSVVGYRALGRGVDRAGIVYANTKRQIDQLRERKRSQSKGGGEQHFEEVPSTENKAQTAAVEPQQK